MRIALDATTWRNSRGYGRHIRMLFGRLAAMDLSNEYIFVNDGEKETDAFPERARIITVPVSRVTTAAASADTNRSLVDLARMSRAISDPNFDLVIFPTVYSYVPVYSHAKVLLFLHDVIPESFPSLTLPGAKSRLFWKAKSSLARRQAHALITVSEYSRQGIARTFGVPPEKIFVVGEASDPVFQVIETPRLPKMLEELGIRPAQRLVVYVGGFGPHKNLTALVDVFSQLTANKEFDDVRLILVGEYKKEAFFSASTDLIDQIHRLGINERIIFTGYMPDEDLVNLLNLAAVSVLPSLMEGFGLPAVEAAACGCPVIATRESPLPDLLGNGGIYINPDKPDELEYALVRVLHSVDLRQSMRLAGLAAAGSLTWERAAEQMAAVITAVVQM